MSPAGESSPDALGPLWQATGPHFFVEPEDVGDGAAVLRGEQARHLTVVLRARPGRAVTLADGTGARYRAEVEQATPDLVRLRVLAAEHVPAASPRLVVVHALPKGRKLDEVVEKLSEIGADRLVPVHSARSEVRLDAAKADRALARWRAIALAAAKQSRRARVLDVTPVRHWQEAFEPADRGVVLWEQARRPLRDALGEALDGPDRPEALLLAIGPEGGLTAAEVAATRLPAATMGPSVLRTETAALVACTITMTLLGRLG